MYMIVTTLTGHSWAYPYDEYKYNLYTSMNCVWSVEIVCV